jgi:hypothetical protein
MFRRIWWKEFLAHSGVLSLDRPAHRDSMFPLSCPGLKFHSTPPIYRPQVSVTYSTLRIEFGVSVVVG